MEGKDWERKDKQNGNLAAGSVTRIFLSITTVTMSDEADNVFGQETGNAEMTHRIGPIISYKPARVH